MDEPSTSAAKDPGQAVGSTEPSPKKSRLSEEAREPLKPPETLEEEFNALRDEYDKKHLDKLVAEKKLTKAQRGFLHKPVHEFMVRSEVFLGNKHHDLADLVSKFGFAKDEQYRRIVGIVQPFGAGKTKTALMLSHAFVVLPIRWTTNQILVKKLEIAQFSLYEAIKIEEVTVGIIQTFSARCKRLMELMLLSVAAVFNLCVKKAAEDLVAEPGSRKEKWFDPKNEQHRLQFALLAISSGSVVVSEIANWFEANIKATATVGLFDSLRTHVLNEVRTTSCLRLVFVMDEVQKLFGETNDSICQGYVLHQLNPQPASIITTASSDIVGNWKKEAANKQPTTVGGRCTDLFYQLGCVLSDWLGVEGAFVTCSTMFETWQRIEKIRSPMLKTERFIDTHWLSASDCKALIRQYFVVTNRQLDALDMSRFARPRFACDLIVKLLKNLLALPKTEPVPVDKWLRASFDDVAAESKEEVTKIVRQLLLEPVLVNIDVDKSIGSNLLISMLLPAALLSAGILSSEIVDFSDLNGSYKCYTDLITAGLLKLQKVPGPGSSTSLAIADQVSAEIILGYYNPETERSSVMGSCAKSIEVNGMVHKQNTSHKGYAMEQVLAYFALRGLLTVPKYTADGMVTYEKLQSTARFAATFDEFKVSKQSLTSNEADYVSQLLGTPHLPDEMNCVLLPSTLSGPDIVFRGKWAMKENDKSYEEVNVCIQMKVENTSYGKQKFLDALDSLDPTTMFAESSAVSSMLWQKKLGNVLKRAPYLRIVFVALGFSNEVQHYVHEFNLRQAQTGSSSFICLLNLDDLQTSLGAVYSVIKSKLEVKEVCPNLLTRNQMPFYASGWKPEEEKKAMLEGTLRDLCRSWDIVHSKKNKGDLVEALDKHELVLEFRTQRLTCGQPVTRTVASACNLQARVASSTHSLPVAPQAVLSVPSLPVARLGPFTRSRARAQAAQSGGKQITNRSPIE